MLTLSVDNVLLLTFALTTRGSATRCQEHWPLFANSHIWSTFAVTARPQRRRDRPRSQQSERTGPSLSTRGRPVLTTWDACQVMPGVASLGHPAPRDLVGDLGRPRAPHYYCP